jgi:3-oxoacyl-[acyl-carrier-protein] synthase II
MAKRKVVITGLGGVTPLGNNAADSWTNILANRSGIGPIDHFDTSNYGTHFAGLVKNLPETPYVSAKEARTLDNFIQYGLIAAGEALADAGIDANPEDAQRAGVAIGSGIGGLGFIEKNHSALTKHSPRKVSPFFVPGSIINMVAGVLSIKYGLKGPNIATATACTSSNHSIGLAARMIQYGDADLMVAGGAEAAVTPLGIAGFNAARALSKRNDNPQAASRPWDQDRDGFVLGNGAGILILEEYQHAKARGADIYAELAGVGMSGDAHHITSPAINGEGAALAMRNALADAQLDASQVDYINAHATSTGPGDIAEAVAIKSVLAQAASQVSISSTKSAIGHLLGAAGAVEAMFTTLAIRDQIVPPTLNLDNPEPGCADLDLVPYQAKERPVQVALSNSFGFGGTNASLVFRQLTD